MSKGDQKQAKKSVTDSTAWYQIFMVGSICAFCGDRF